jgi:hypothetical protein
VWQTHPVIFYEGVGLAVVRRGDAESLTAVAAAIGGGEIAIDEPDETDAADDTDEPVDIDAAGDGDGEASSVGDGDSTSRVREGARE